MSWQGVHFVRRRVLEGCQAILYSPRQRAGEHDVCDTYTESRGKLDLSAQGGGLELLTGAECRRSEPANRLASLLFESTAAAGAELGCDQVDSIHG